MSETRLTHKANGWPDFKPGVLYLTDAELAHPAYERVADYFTVVRIPDTWASDAVAQMQMQATPRTNYAGVGPAVWFVALWIVVGLVLAMSA